MHILIILIPIQAEKTYNVLEDARMCTFELRMDDLYGNDQKVSFCGYYLNEWSKGPSVKYNRVPKDSSYKPLFTIVINLSEMGPRNGNFPG